MPCQSEVPRNALFADAEGLIDHFFVRAAQLGGILLLIGGLGLLLVLRTSRGGS